MERDLVLLYWKHGGAIDYPVKPITTPDLRDTVIRISPDRR